jgi:carboxyl-terminal processing protease
MDNPTKNKAYLLPLLMAACVIFGLWLGTLFTSGDFTFSNVPIRGKYQKFQDIIELLNENYVDSLNGDELFEAAISDMLHKLDPHSNYIPAKDLKAVNESIEGQFGGIGIRFFIIRDTICITNVIPGSPSESVGLKAGDKIIAVDGKKVANKKITNDKVMKLLKGKEDTSVALTIYRKGKKLTKNLTRGIIQIQSVSSAFMMTPTIGYLKIDEFSVTTGNEFKLAALKLKQEGMKKLVLDLRGNSGGVMQSAIEIADQFLQKDAVIVRVKGVHAGEQTYKATSDGFLQDMPLSILINSNSASASEILAGAIQDNDRGTIVGRRSFGKGLVQEDRRLRDGSNLRMTIARYYIASGRCIQKPYSEGFDAYMQDQINRYSDEELFHVDKKYFVDSLKYKTVKGRTVYGSSGIMPDVFVALDTLGTSMYFTELRFSQAFNGFAFDYIQDKRRNWKTLEEFVAAFQVDELLLNQFTQFAEKELKIKVDKGGLKTSKNLIKQTLKAEIARQVWLENGYFKITNTTDNEVQKALKIIQ